MSAVRATLADESDRSRLCGKRSSKVLVKVPKNPMSAL